MRSKSLLYLVWMIAGGTCVEAQTDPAAPRFEKDILPIFTTYCFTCHGKTSPQLGLDLRTAASTFRGSHNGPVVVRGSLENSLLWQKVSSKAMPPEVFGQKLPEHHIETIRRWIAAGALSDQPVLASSKEAGEQKALFEKEILPLFTARCVQCHGAHKPMAGLDLRTLPALLKGSTSGPVVIEGFSEKSILVRKVASGNMPPKGAGAPLNDAEIQTLRRWIDKGQFVDAVEAEVHAEREFTKAEAPEVTEEDRAFWSFRPPVASPVPKPAGVRRVRTPIDAFILSKLEAKNLSFSPDAPNLTLMRRAYFDLIGLAPTPEEIRLFVEDTKPGAYERLIDRLLASPHYGERWGRHWLDAVGYVDTEDKDFEPTRIELAEGMWRYRDYVIKSTNDDKPWNRFLTEQIAGDELVDWRTAEKYTPEIVEALTATGYLRTVLDITNADILNLPVERYEALFKLVEKVSSSTLGLTMACARCHSHKFDPIPQKDYYRFLALFTPAYNPSNWVQPKNRVLYTVSQTEQKEIEAHNAEIDRPIADLKKQLAATRAPYENRLLEEKLQAIPEVIRVETRLALDTPKEKRDDVQKFLFEKFQKQLKVSDEEVAKALKESDRATVEKLQGKIDTLKTYRRKLEKIQALWDVGPPPNIRLLQRGSAESPGPKVDPGFPTVLCATGNSTAVRPASAQGKTSGLRLAFAEWLTDPANPLTARVIVNRIWQHHFGTGIVATSDNFGRTGSVPTHPELLDWLAVDFMKHGWSAKRLHKMIMTSTVYRQSSRQPGEAWVNKARSIDPGNQLLWRMNLRRLEAEILRDNVLNAGGKLDRSMGGPPVMLDMRRDGLQMVSAKEPPAAQYRRSVYLLARRTYPLNFLGVFDYPVIDTHCARRVPSATPLQSLTMLNDDFVVDNAGHLASRVHQIAGEDAPVAGKIETAYSLTLSRPPSRAEIKLAEEHLEQQQQQYINANVAAQDAAARSFVSFAQMLLGSNEFLYVE
jgi:mono/diheme cytochrome c family protein